VSGEPVSDPDNSERQFSLELFDNSGATAMNKYNQQTSSSTAVVVILAVLALGAALLVGCALVGLLFFRMSRQEAMVVQDMAMQAQVEPQRAQQIAERERQRAEENAREAERQAKLAAEQIADKETGVVLGAAASESAAAELRIEFDAEGHMAVEGEALDWEQVAQRLRELEGQSSSRVLILANKECRMEPILKLLQTAGDIGVETTIRALPPSADETH